MTTVQAQGPAARTSWAESLLLAAVVAAVAWLALLLPYLIAPGVRLEFDEDSPAPLSYARGFHLPEGTGGAETFVWAGPNARLLLPALPRSTPWTLTIRARTPRPAGVIAAPVTLAERGRSLAVVRFVPPDGAPYAVVDVALPTADQAGLRLDIVSGDSFSPGPPDVRQLAIQIDAISLTPSSRFGGMPWRRTAVAAGALALLAWLVGIAGSARAAAGGAVAAAIALGLLAHTSSWLYLPTFDAIYGASWLALAVLGVGVGIRWAWSVPRDAADPAIAIAVWFTVAKFALLIHPSMTIGDSSFHQNRFELVDGGTYLFTSAAPGGEFPYPVAFYVALDALSSRVASVEVMRGLALAADSVAGLLVALAVGASDRRAAMALVVVLWQTAPVLFQVQALAYLTNSFGNSWSAIAAALTIRGVRPGAALWLVPAVAAAVIADLSHVSSFVLLLMALGAVTGFAALLRRWRLAAAGALVLALSAGLAWGVYYRHFTALYAQRLTAPAAVAAPAAAAIPVQRSEAHQTVHVPGWPALRQRLAFVPLYVAKYLGVGLLALTLLAGWRCIRGGQPLDDAGVFALGVAAAVAVAFVLGQLTAIDLRYYLVGASLCVPIAAAAAASTLDSASPASRGATVVLTAIAVAQGCWYMARFLWNPLPR